MNQNVRLMYEDVEDMLQRISVTVKPFAYFGLVQLKAISISQHDVWRMSGEQMIAFPLLFISLLNVEMAL